MKQIMNNRPLPNDIDPSWRIGIVASSFYEEEIDSLIAAATKTLTDAGIDEEKISFHIVPGSFEIPLLGAALAKNKTVDALIAFGIIVEGETQHARLLADNTARGIMDVQVQYCIPFAFEVLYVDDLKTAQERCKDKNNKGVEAAHAVLHSLAQLRAL